MSKASDLRADRDESIATLRKILPPGSTVYTVLRHRARSGMFRRISLLAATVDRDGKPQISDITWDVARAMERPIKGRGGYVQDVGIGVSGAGMDMGFHLVMNLSYVLHGHTPIGTGVEAHDKGRPHHPDPDNYRPGYTLIHRWI
jgi:hypothetical protein